MLRLSRAVSVASVGLLFALQISASLANTKAPTQFDFPAEPLDKALRDIAVQAKCNISYEPKLVAGLMAPSVSGVYTSKDALSIILAGTELRAVDVNENTLEISQQPNANAQADGILTGKQSKPENAVHLAYAPVTNGGQSSVGTDNDSAPGRKDLEEITVTGTHIRGIGETPVAVQVFSRADIDATGATTVAQFLQTIPQNFNGGASENTIGSITGSGQTNNTVNGSAPNLRGLGSDATLVLINGHRVAPGNSDGAFVDVSMIPVSAIERIEIVTDGASAIYGSDAVGGVVNFILRTKFDGAEARFQAGSVSSGAMHDIQAGQTVGTDWRGGSAVLSYQYSDKTPLTAESRDYLRTALLPFTVIPEEVQHAAFANIQQEILPGFDVHADAAYSHRSTYSVTTYGDPTAGAISTGGPSTIDGYSATLGSTVKLARDNELAVLATYSESDTKQPYYQTPSTTPLVYNQDTKSAIMALDVNLDGALVTLPAGDVHYAVGGQYRKETFGNTYLFPPTDNTFYPRRNVGAGYVEFRVPLWGVKGAPPSLELTLADRVEHYSDFGSTNNPQIGAIFRPVESVTFRSTYGTSFKAPLLSGLNPVPQQVASVPGGFFTPTGSAIPNTLIEFGGNPELKPEKATVWTFGLDFKPVAAPGFSAKLGYYNIVFKNQIVNAQSSICLCDVFLDQAILGTAILNRNPSKALIQQLIAEPTYQNFFNIDPNTIGALVDSRSLNLSTAKTSGLDFHFAYKFPVSSVQVDTGLDGTYIFRFDNQFTSQSPPTSLLNTLFNPTDLRLRGRAMLTYGGWSTGIFLNFTNAYTNNQVTPEEHISSWTTADFSASYQFPSDAVLFKDLTIAFSVINVADRDPPYVSIPYNSFNVYFDGANANAIGRYFSLRLQKKW